MNTCDTCKWWGEPEDSEIQRQCGNPHIDAGSVTPPPDRLDAASLQQWGMDAGYVSLATGPKFGCVHWEVRGLVRYGPKEDAADKLHLVRLQTGKTIRSGDLFFDVALFKWLPVSEDCSVGRTVSDVDDIRRPAQ